MARIFFHSRTGSATRPGAEPRAAEMLCLKNEGRVSRKEFRIPANVFFQLGVKL